MPDLEDRVAALEERVDQIDVQGRDATTLAAIATRDALASRDAHLKNVELLGALRETQAEHSATLAEQSATLAEHTATLAEHTATLAEHSATLAEHTATLAEHGRRLDSIDGKLGQVTVGVYTIEGLLRGLVEDQ
ncbi:hypothetical protein [Phytoactinopolyspora limicola]|uniref:hypothetical protein n=1 Tax=Phytoactinopolyspora limicola TaxID=2715536 RepID=UPI00140DBF40|nr:hypothetical protein [Phytoactinopolyspora limicola]